MKCMLCFFLTCLLLVPASIMGEESPAHDRLIKVYAYSSLFGNEESLYIANKGTIKQYLPEENEALVAIDDEDVYPFLMEGEVYVFSRESEYITRLVPQDDVAPVHQVSITRELAGGGEGWYLRSLKADDEALYFLYTDQIRETPLLCRYRFEDKDFDRIEIEWLNEYVLTSEGETLAIAPDPEKTTVYAVDWQGNKHQELYRLTGRWAGFAQDGNDLYATDITGLSFVRLQAGKEQAKIRSPYAAGVTAGQVTLGKYYALGSAGLYRPDFSAAQSEARVLRVLEGYADESDRAFMLAYPDVKIEYIPSTVYEGIDFGTALITGILSYDVGNISNVTAAAESLMEKGYMLDLSQSPELLQKAHGMYKPVRDFIFKDGQLMIMPYTINISNMAEYNEDNLRASGVSAEELPRTTEDYLDFIISWPQEHDELESSADIVPTMGSEENYMTYLTQTMQAYASHYRRMEKDLNFDTGEFRELLRKAKEAADATPIQTETINYRSLWYYTGNKVPAISSLVFPMSVDESPRYTGSISGYIIDPRSTQKELALEYIAWRIDALSDLEKLMLYEGQYKALERKDFPALMENMLKDKALIKEAIAREESQAEKRNLQERLDKINADIEHPDNRFRYQITDAEIAFYQQEVIPNLEFPFTDITTEYSYNNVDTWRMMQRYIDDEMDTERFIQELNQRERLRRLENQ